MVSNNRNSGMEVRFWGARGTLPTPGPQFSKAGGNTNCTTVSCGNDLIIFDAGTGLRELGSQLAANGVTSNIHLFLTHAHYDHVEGVPFFAPFFNPQSKIKVYCGKLDESDSTEQTVKGLMRRPYFPVGPDVFAADVTYVDLDEYQKLDIGSELKISSCPLNHPGGATGYRIDYNGKSFACITDTEHFPDKDDHNIIDLIENVDSFIYDCSLTEEEYPDFVGYGHSTYEVGLRLQKLSGAKQLIGFHHMPFRVDAELDKIEKMIKKHNAANMVAREGVSFTL